ncbi:MerR family transcriptional regulator [Virgibacillus sp. NKC19-3]|uniref:MerR family transcriptional regulator n=1 Tax=Virgibacillus saliphilus TaxID=2831674 RepID=UPI001C9B3E2E|nr:MerR family transcriptional regulator [Virgibacillus sp. NKC19-3]MBY7141615.1 MerR family transcriptional regulator [Virgibacillus sp. NKC19-3]
MNEKMYTVKEFADLTGVTERTLRYYDRKGVLVPTNYNKKGHRLYNHEDIIKMQNILTLKYLDFSLKEIIENLSKHSINSVHDTLDKQKEMLKKKRAEIDNVIRTITRVEQIIKQEEVESDLLLGIIHSIQIEKRQEDWLSNHLTKPIVDQVFMQHMSEEEKLNTEREQVIAINKLQAFYENGISPNATEVQNLMKQLEEILNKVIEPEYQEELEKLKSEESSTCYFSLISKGLQEYAAEASRILNEENNIAKDNIGGGDQYKS